MQNEDVRLLVIECFFWVWVSYGFGVLLHELGHALGGQLLGGELYLLRIGRLLWLRSGGWMLWEKSTTTPGECLVLCRSCKGVLITAASGSVMNLAIGVLVLMRSVLLSNNTIRVSALCFGLVSVLLAGMNWNIGRRDEIGDGGIYRQVKQKPELAKKYIKEQQNGVFLLEF